MILHLEAHYKNAEEEGTAVADIPYEDGQHILPKVYPFTKNVYLGPDYGYSLHWISVDVGRKILRFGYDVFLYLDENGKAEWREEFKSGEVLEYRFTLK